MREAHPAQPDQGPACQSGDSVAECFARGFFGFASE